jgi:hypothetical protein
MGRWSRSAAAGAREKAWIAGGLRLVGHAASLWVTASVFLVYNDSFLHNGMEYDESFFVWCGWCILKGLVPYKQFLEYKPPLIFLTHALALDLFGFAGLRFRYFFLAFPLGALLFAQAALLFRKVDRFLATALSVGIIWIFVNPAFHDTALSDSESIGFTYFLIGFAFLLLESKYRNLTDALGGAFLTCCAFSKEPYAPAVLTTWMSVFILRDGITDFRVKALRYLKFTALGVAVVIAGLVLYLGPTGGLAAYVRMTADYTRLYRDPRLSYCVVLGRVHPSTPWNNFLFAWDGIRKNLLNVSVLAHVCPLFIAAFVFIARRSWLLLATTCAGLVAGLWATTASNCQWAHYYNLALGGYYPFLAIGLDAMKGPFAALDRWSRTFVRAVVVAMVAITVLPKYEDERTVLHVTQPPQEPYPGIFSFIEKNSAPGDRIFTTGPPVLYVHTNRLDAVRESNFVDEIIAAYPGETDEEKLHPIRLELEQHPPKIVFLDPERADRKKRHMSALITPFLADFNYRKVSEYIYVRP